MASRVHIRADKLGKCSLSVAEVREGPFINIESGMCLPIRKERIVKVGSIPCRFIRIVFDNSIIGHEPEIYVYGLMYNQIGDKIEIGAEKYLFDVPYEIVYGKN